MISLDRRLASARGRPLRMLKDRALPDSTSGAARAMTHVVPGTVWRSGT